MVRGCGVEAAMSIAARRAWPHYQRSMTSTPNMTTGADAADHCKVPRSDNGPRFSQGRTRLNPISWGDLAQRAGRRPWASAHRHRQRKPQKTTAVSTTAEPRRDRRQRTPWPAPWSDRSGHRTFGSLGRRHGPAVHRWAIISWGGDKIGQQRPIRGHTGRGHGGVVHWAGMSPDGRTRRFLARNSEGLSPMGHYGHGNSMLE